MVNESWTKADFLKVEKRYQKENPVYEVDGKWVRDERTNGNQTLSWYATKVDVWWQDELFHREDGPAVVYTNGAESWYKHGKRHREDGPAHTRPNGKGGLTKEYWLDGKWVTKAKHEELVWKQRAWEKELLRRKGAKK